MITLEDGYTYNKNTEAGKILTQALEQKELDEKNGYISPNSFNSETNRILYNN